MPQLLHRLFYALAPSARERNLIGVQRDAVTGARTLVSNERLHLTLGITDDFPDFPDAVARRMQTIGDGVAAEPFSLSLDRISGGAHSVALRPSHRCAGLSELQRQLGSALKLWNIHRDGWSFSPHVTLLYWQGQPFLQPISSIQLDVSEFVLIHSVVGASQHRVLARWVCETQQESFAF